MSVYIILLLSILIACVYEQQACPVYSPKTRGFGAFLFVFALGLVVGLRDMMGGYDVYVYEDVFLFDAAHQEFNLKMFFVPGGAGARMEPGWLIYNLLIGKVTTNSYVFFFLTAMISYLMLFRHLRRYAPYFFFALLIIFCRQFLQSFVYIRQFLACMIAWFALDFALKRKLIPFLLIVFIAMSVHVCGLIFLFVYPIANKKLPIWVMFGGVAVALTLGLTPAFASFLNSVGGVIESEKALGYAGETGGGVHFFYLAEGLMIFLGIVVAQLSSNRERFFSARFSAKMQNSPSSILAYRDMKIHALLNITFLYVCASLTTIQSPGMMRLIWVFWIGPICALPYVCEKLVVGGGRNLLKTLIVLYFITAFFLFCLRFNAGELTNYKSILF